jgi:hypothetical protein
MKTNGWAKKFLKGWGNWKSEMFYNNCMTGQQMSEAV